MKASNTVGAIKRLLKAQMELDPWLEAEALREIFPVRKKPGKQHADRSLISRLWECTRIGATDCWHWVGSHDVQGYGHMSYDGRNHKVHRLAYMAFIGEIPDGKLVLHKCDNTACINPDHLYIGTHSDNRRDCQNRGRWKLHNPKRGLSHHKTAYTAGDLDRMRDLRRQGFSFEAIINHLSHLPHSASNVRVALMRN